MVLRSTEKSKQIVGVLMGVPITCTVFGASVQMVHLDFLCLAKFLRMRRMAPILFQEIFRRARVLNFSQCIFTSSVDVPGIVGDLKVYRCDLHCLADVRFLFAILL